MDPLVRTSLLNAILRRHSPTFLVRLVHTRVFSSRLSCVVSLCNSLTVRQEELRYAGVRGFIGLPFPGLLISLLFFFAFTCVYPRLPK